jgi:hypothetical protein
MIHGLQVEHLGCDLFSPQSVRQKSTQWSILFQGKETLMIIMKVSKTQKCIFYQDLQKITWEENGTHVMSTMWY